MVEKFGEGREYEEKKKESPKKNAEKKDSETSKQLDKLHADVDIKQQTNAFEHDKNKELSEIKEDMDDLKKAVPMKKISSQESSQPAYEQMSDEQIASVADKGRTQSADRVQRIVQQSSRIPDRLKKMTT